MSSKKVEVQIKGHVIYAKEAIPRKDGYLLFILWITQGTHWKITLGLLKNNMLELLSSKIYQVHINGNVKYPKELSCRMRATCCPLFTIWPTPNLALNFVARLLLKPSQKC